MSYEHYQYDPYVRIWNRMADHGEICNGGFDPENDPDDRGRLLAAVIVGIVILVLAAVFTGCSRRVYVPVEHTTTVYETLHDTIVEVQLQEVRDTVTVDSDGQDTLSYLRNDYAYSFASINNGVLGHSLGILPGTVVRDSIQVKYIHRIDSIPYPVTVEVEKKLTFWQNMKIEYGGFAMGLATALAFVMGVLVWQSRKRE